MNKKNWNLLESALTSHWRNGKKLKAIALYEQLGRPFWHSEAIGRYYERHGQMDKAVKEYEHVVRQYFKMDILPLPRGPVELFKLGKWYSTRSPRKARKFLMLYLRAEKEDMGTGFGIRHKVQAQKILALIPAGQKAFWKGFV